MAAALCRVTTRRPGGSPPGLSPAVLRVRNELAARRERLDHVAPEALDPAAEFLAELHGRLWGRAARLAGDRSPRYRRAQLAGERGVQLEDLCFLVLHDDQARGVVARLLGAV